MLIQKIISDFRGTVFLSIPVLIIAFAKPNLFSMPGAILAISLAIGVFIVYTQYLTTKKSSDVLQFIPSGEFKEQFNKEITRCGMNPSNVSVRYAYCDDQIAKTILNTVALDPFVFKNIDNDPNAVNAKNLVAQHVLPNIPDYKKHFHSKINESLTEPAQNFIFRHELGHVFDNYSIKICLFMGLIISTLIFCGISVAVLLTKYMPVIPAVIIGIITADIIDNLSSYFIFNAIYKYSKEKKADWFASKYSSKEEINAAADFFEEYENHSNEYKKAAEITLKISQRFWTGHPDGKSRASYLRNLASNK